MSSVLSQDPPTDEYFHCLVPQEQGQAVLKAARRSCRAQVHDTSIDGFTIMMDAKEARKLKVGETWILEYDGSRLEVLGQWYFNAPDGRVQMGLRRMRDLTPVPVFRTPFLSRFTSGRIGASATSSAGFGGFIIVLFLAMALPGLGEQLGTADRIQSAVQWVYTGFGEIFR